MTKRPRIPWIHLQTIPNRISTHYHTASRTYSVQTHTSAIRPHSHEKYTKGSWAKSYTKIESHAHLNMIQTHFCDCNPSKLLFFLISICTLLLKLTSSTTSSCVSSTSVGILLSPNIIIIVLEESRHISLSEFKNPSWSQFGLNPPIFGPGMVHNRDGTGK